MQRIFHETSPFFQAQMQTFEVYVHLCIYSYVFLLLSLLPNLVNPQLNRLLIPLEGCLHFTSVFQLIVFYILVPIFAVLLPRFLHNGFQQIYTHLSQTSCIPVNSMCLWPFLHTPQVAHPWLSGLPFGKFLLTFV